MYGMSGNAGNSRLTSANRIGAEYRAVLWKLRDRLSDQTHLIA